MLCWIQVFSLVDTKSLMQASACCTMFKKCANDSFCYSNIDLTNVNVKSRVVRSMIFKAVKELRSDVIIKPKSSSIFSISLFLVYLIISWSLFVDACRSLKVGLLDKSKNSLLSGTCLAPLSYNHGFLGYWLYYHNYVWLTIPYILLVSVALYLWYNCNFFFFSIQQGISWQAYTFTISNGWRISPYVVPCPSAQI